MTSADGNNGVGPLSDPVSVNAPQMGDKRRRPILPTKRDTTEKKGADIAPKSRFLPFSLVLFPSFYLSLALSLSRKRRKRKKKELTVPFNSDREREHTEKV